MGHVFPLGIEFHRPFRALPEDPEELRRDLLPTHDRRFDRGAREPAGRPLQFAQDLLYFHVAFRPLSSRTGPCCTRCGGSALCQNCLRQ